MRYDLSPLAEAEIEALEAEGISLTASDVLRINALAKRVETPHSRIALSRGVPCRAGGVYLWPMTLAGSDWYKRVGCELYRTQKWQTLTLAYALAHGSEPMPEDEDDARQAVGRWGKGLRCRLETVVEAIRQVTEQDEYPDDTQDAGKPAAKGEIVLMLSAMTRTPAEAWEYQCSLTYALAMLEAMIAQNEADGKSTKHDPRIKAERALGLRIALIRKRHLKAAGNG